MTGLELAKVFRNDYPCIYAFGAKKAKVLGRELRKGFGKMAFACYDLAVNGTRYKVCIGVTPKALRHSYTVLAYVKERNEYVNVSIVGRSTLPQFAYTTHCLKRYAERYMKSPDASLNAIIANIEKNIVYTIELYHDGGENHVWANSAGLFLQKHDDKRDIRICKTFVSVEMLKTSQIAAYASVAGLIEEYSKTFNSIAPHDVYTISKCFNQDLLRQGVTHEMLQELYGEFFEKKQQCLTRL